MSGKSCGGDGRTQKQHHTNPRNRQCHLLSEISQAEGSPHAVDASEGCCLGSSCQCGSAAGALVAESSLPAPGSAQQLGTGLSRHHTPSSEVLLTQGIGLSKQLGSVTQAPTCSKSSKGNTSAWQGVSVCPPTWLECWLQSLGTPAAGTESNTLC